MVIILMPDQPDGDENDDDEERERERESLPKTFYHSSSLRTPQAKYACSIPTLSVPTCYNVIWYITHVCTNMFQHVFEGSLNGEVRM